MRERKATANRPPRGKANSFGKPRQAYTPKFGMIYRALRRAAPAHSGVNGSIGTTQPDAGRTPLFPFICPQATEWHSA